MEGIIKRVKGVTGKSTKVIATGGCAKIIASQSSVIKHIEPGLVLEGARLIYERVRLKKK